MRWYKKVQLSDLREIVSAKVRRTKTYREVSRMGTSEIIAAKLIVLLYIVFFIVIYLCRYEKEFDFVIRLKVKGSNNFEFQFV